MISIRIAELMAEKEMNAEQLSRKIGVSASIIRRWTKKDTSLFLKNLLKLADVFECSLEYLCGRSEDDKIVSSKSCPPFAEQLRKVLAEKEVSVYRILQDTKLYSATLQSWLKGAEPTLFNLIKLADYLDCTLDYLVGREI